MGDWSKHWDKLPLDHVEEDWSKNWDRLPLGSEKLLEIKKENKG